MWTSANLWEADCSNKWIFQFKESVLVQLIQRIIFVWYSAFDLTSDFKFNSMHFGVLRCDCFGSTFFFIISRGLNAIYFRSTIFCAAVDQKNFAPFLHRILTGLHSWCHEDPQTLRPHIPKTQRKKYIKLFSILQCSLATARMERVI